VLRSWSRRSPLLVPSGASDITEAPFDTAIYTPLPLVIGFLYDYTETQSLVHKRLVSERRRTPTELQNCPCSTREVLAETCPSFR
jgi:hypothetical protein